MWVRDARFRGWEFTVGDAQAANYREYGDAGLLVDTARRTEPQLDATAPRLPAGKRGA
jgi:hypothetical protein